MKVLRPFKRPRRMVVQSVRVVGGRRVFTVLDPTNVDVVANAVAKSWGGSETSYTQMPVACPIPSDRFVIVPEEANAAEAWIDFDRDGVAYVDGVTPRECVDLQDKAPLLEDGEEHPGTFGPHDMVWANGAIGDDPTKVIMGEDRSFNVLANGSVRIQVPEGFTVRLTKDGDGGMPVVKFEPCQDAFNRVIDRLNEVSEGLAEAYRLCALLKVAGGVLENPFLTIGNSFEHVPEDDVGDEIASQTLFVPYDDDDGDPVS